MKEKEPKIEKIKPEEEEMEKEEPLAEKEGAERLLSPDVKIGETVKHKEEIESFEGKDFAFENEDQYSSFKKAVENDKQFETILKNVKSFLNESGELDLLDPQKIEALREMTKELPLIEKYIALTYMGTEFGVKKTEPEDGEEWWIKPKKEGKIKFPYRISTWHHENLSDAAIKAFSLDNMYTYWDEETALNNPLSDSKRDWMELKFGLPHVVAHYLKEKGLITTNKKEIKRGLYEKLKKDKELVSTLERTGFSEDELKEILGVEDIFKEHDKVEAQIETLQKGKRTGEKYLIKNGKTIFIEDFPGPSDDRGWDVRIRRSMIHIVGPDINQVEKFEPYWRYEDFPGGKTHTYKGEEVKEIKDVKETKESYIVDYLDGVGKKKSVTIEKEENVIPPKEAEKRIGKIIKELGDEWLSPGNKKPIAMGVRKYGELEMRMGNYPYFITYKIEGNKAYMATVKLIDAERYDELLIDGLEQGIVLDPQFQTELYTINLNTEKREYIGSNTTDRNDTRRIVISADEHDGKVEFVMKPEIRLLPDKKVKVNLEVRKGAEWTNLTLYEGPVEAIRKEKEEK